MKILAIHNFHRKGSASGDDQVYKSETELLENKGQKVVKYTVSNDSFDDAGLVGKILSAFGMLWSFKNYKGIKEIIEKENPDVVHVHTFFPLLSPAILYAAKKCNKKVVATLHDTRLICPCAISLRDNKTCDLCGDGKYYRMVKYKCYKNSSLYSLIVATIFKFHRLCRTFYEQIDRYICLNDNQIKQLGEIGFEKEKIVKKYNFVKDVDEGMFDNELQGLPDRYVVYYGRLGVEKGIHMLEKVWESLPDIPLVVMGGGPLEEDFAGWAKQHPNVNYMGYVEHKKCLNIVKNAQFIVFPSICYEGCSMVVIETESLGKPIIATDLGFAREAIIEGKNGLKIELANVEQWVKSIQGLWRNPYLIEEMGVAARRDYEEKYMPEDNYNQLMAIYNDLLSEES